MEVSLGSADRQHTDVSPTSYSEDGPPTKARKITRACDFCKVRKSKCSGDQPCSKCVIKGRTCVYSAQYTRGRPPTPRLSTTPSSTSGLQISFHKVQDTHRAGKDGGLPERETQSVLPGQSAPPSRASPELGMAEIQGQVFDPTSGLTFLHRAWKRLAVHGARITPEAGRASVDSQHITMAGDRALPSTDETEPFYLPEPHENKVLLDLYFDVCIATYRILHRPSVELWLTTVEGNLRDGNPVWHGIGPAKAAIVLVALAIAKIHQEKSKGFSSTADESRAQSESDRLFSSSVRLTDQETGYPKLDSAQARLVQTLYLLTTSRFNRSWYVFGSALQVISAIGLHRRENPNERVRIGASRVPEDYIQAQCRLRTFWTAYVLDSYLGVIFGRPRHFHDDLIDQSFPDRVNDEDMTVSGPVEGHDDAEEFHIDGLIFHAKIGQIIGSITTEVYTIKGNVSENDRIAAARRLIQQVHEWRASLPPHLGLIRPSLLIPAYRRQATVLKLAYSHAIMHASRLFILGSRQPLQQNDSKSPHDQECISAARAVLETVDYMAREGPIFHAFWWTHYVTFCALVVTYVWEIQQRRLNRPNPGGKDRRAKLLELAEKCQQHLARATATNSPSRRYAVILEEFRAAAISQPLPRPDAEQTTTRPSQEQQMVGGQQDEHNPERMDEGLGVDDEQSFSLDHHLLDAWQTTDWLDLDSSVSIDVPHACCLSVSVLTFYRHFGHMWILKSCYLGQELVDKSSAIQCA